MKASENQFPSVTLQEVATDGSDLTNPAADHRRLFLGEDGALHLRDSSGTVTAVGGGIADQGAFTYLDGTEAAAPGTPASGKVRLYAKTDGLLYSKDDAGTETLVSGGSGGGANWAQVINESGTSFANFTGTTGTWSSNGTEIIETDTAASMHRCWHSTQVPLGFPTIVETEVMCDDNGSAGIIIYDKTNNSGVYAYVDTDGDFVRIDKESAGTLVTASATINTSTWYKVRIVLGNAWASLYLDGTLKGSGILHDIDTNAEWIGFANYGCAAKYRNFKVWTLTTNAPA